MSRYLAVLAASLALFAPAHAQDGSTEADVRCMAVTMMGLANGNPQIQTASLMAGLYYLGRIDGREPQLDLAAAVEREVRPMRAEQMQAEAQRCSAYLKGRGEALRAVGERIKADAAKTAS